MEDNRSKILIVDDATFNIELLIEVLGKDYEIIFATSGVEGIKIAQLEFPDLILLDVIMPDMNGYETCKRLKADSRTSAIPIIFISAMSDEEDERQGLELGAIDYITKPISPSIVKIRIKNHLELKHYRDFLENISLRDGLTGISNRRRFDEYLLQEWRRAQRYKTFIGLIMIDVDLFKKYNDTYGHIEGDDCLRKVAKTLNNCLKRPADMLARYGGEEFVCILPDTDPKGSLFIAQNLRQSVFNMGIPHLSSVIGFVTISLGVSTLIPSNEMLPSSIVKIADNCLYEAKKAGRNQVKSDINTNTKIGI